MLSPQRARKCTDRSSYDGLVDRETEQHDITELLARVGRDGDEAANELLDLVYTHLRGMAARRMSGERADHTLQPTALVHETYLRLIGPRRVPWRDRAHFLAASAEAMRQVLLDHAKARGRRKRGGGATKLPLDIIDLAAADDSATIIELDEAVARLETEAPEIAAVVKLRFYGGQSIEETATALGTSPRSVNRAWTFARAWLHRALT